MSEYLGGPDLGAHATDDGFFDLRRRPSILSAGSMYMIATMGVVGLKVVSYLGRRFFPLLMTSYLYYALDTLFQMLLVLLPVLIYRKNHEGVDWSMRLRAPRPSAVLISVAAALCMLVLGQNVSLLWGILIQSLGGRFEPSGLSVGAHPAQVMLALGSLALLPALCEEMLFRGAILGAFERRGTARALVITSVLFALLHGSAEALPVQLLQGFIIGFLVITSDSLLSGIAYHFAYNAGAVVFAVLSGGEKPLGGESLYALNGGIFGVLIALLRLLVMGGVLAVLLLAASSEREQSGRPFERPGPLDRAPYDWQELVVIMSGLVAVLSLLGVDVLKMLWVV